LNLDIVERSLVRKLEIRVIQHATESREKLLRALKTLFPEEIRNRIEISEHKARGHYGNPIVLYTCTVEGTDANLTLKWILSKMPSASKSLLRATIHERLQGKINLHLRIHKQLLVEGHIVLWEGDETVKILVQLKNRKALEELIGTYLS